jgi:tetratricopeptide (TPR) repeat protein
VEARYSAGCALFYARRYDDAIRDLRVALALDPKAYAARVFLAASFAFKGEHQQAIAQCDSIGDMQDSFQFQALVGYVYAISGGRDNAVRILARMLDLERVRFVDPYCLAMLQAGLGEKEQAFQSLQRALDVHSAILVCVKAESFLDSLRSDPRYGRLVRAVGLAEGP